MENASCRAVFRSPCALQDPLVPRPWTIAGENAAYFVGWCPACGTRYRLLTVTLDGGRHFRRYGIRKLSGYQATAIRIRDQAATITARRGFQHTRVDPRPLTLYRRHDPGLRHAPEMTPEQSPNRERRDLFGCRAWTTTACGHRSHSSACTTSTRPSVSTSTISVSTSTGRKARGDDLSTHCGCRAGPSHFTSPPTRGTGHTGAAVVIQVDDVAALHRDVDGKTYLFMNPGIEPRGMAGKSPCSIPPRTRNPLLLRGRKHQGHT